MKRLINNQSQKNVRRELRKNQTKEEELLWFYIRNKKIDVKFRRQVSIGVFIADFFCAEKLLAIELDGVQHLDNKEYDQERNNYFNSLNIKTIRFWNSEISDKNMENVFIKIKAFF